MFNTKQVALFSDLHIGVHKDQPEWHNVALNFGNWFVEDLKKKKIKDIIFCGDFFHTRHEIEQTTLKCGIDFLSKFNDFNIVMIPGNHCCYFKNNTSIHSLEIFKPWKNITIFDKPTCVTYNSKKYMFCPWETDLNQIEGCDIIFGHFELANFKMNTFKVCEHGQDSKSLLEKCKKIVTGHFHLREHRQYEPDKEVLYLGSPYQMDFGERGHLKGYTILDLDTEEFTFVENKKSPQHIKINLTDLLKQTSNLSNLKQSIENNIVCFIVDKKIEQDKLSKIIATLNCMNPFQLRIDYNIYESFINREEQEEIIGVNVQKSIAEFIESMSVDVDKKELIKTIENIFIKCTV